MSRYALVILLAISSLSLGYHQWIGAHAPTLRLMVGPLDPAVLVDLKQAGARVEEDGFSIRADGSGAHCLYKLRARHLASRDLCIENLRNARQGTDSADEARLAKRARQEEGLANVYDRALRKMEQLDSNLLVDHNAAFTEGEAQLLHEEEACRTELPMMFDGK